MGRGFKRIVATFLFALCLIQSGCGIIPDQTKQAGDGGDWTKGSVFFLNFKPEAKDTWMEIAREFKSEVGIDVQVETPITDTYEDVLAEYIGNNRMPSLFQINGEVGYESWSDYCADLSGTNFYELLSDKSLAIANGDGIYGIPYTVEGYGILYNKKIFKKYFELRDRDTSFQSIRDVNNYENFRQLVVDMNTHKSELGITGVFGVTSMKGGNQWRWHTHLANLPIYFEYQDKNQNTAKEINFTYGDNMKHILDLYLNFSTQDRDDLVNYTVDDSMSEFAKEKCAMVQNGNWSWGQIASTDNRKIASDSVGILPIYIGVEGEESQGLCIGTENYWCVNSYATPDDQAATLKFVDWFITSKTGKKYAKEKLEFIMPFSTMGTEDAPTNPLARAVQEDINNEKTTSVSWVFTTFPGENFKLQFGDMIMKYSEKRVSWEELAAAVKAEWKKESASEMESESE